MTLTTGNASRSANDTERPAHIRNIAELARLAGVSAGTVSRALAGKSVVNAETRAAIQALADRHGFRLNQMARNLRTQKTSVIGVVIPLGHDERQHISDPFFMTMIGLFADRLTENGYDLMLSRIVPRDREWLDRITSSGMLDGVLLIGQSDQFETIERVAANYRPLVAWGEHRDGQMHCSVGTDNYVGGKLAAERLMARGATRLAFLGDIGPPEMAARCKGASDAVAAAGHQPVEVMPTPLSSDAMVPHIDQHFANVRGRIDGIVAASDVIAMRALRVLADKRIKVPGDVALVGYDDLPLASHTVPRLTSVHQDLRRGAAAMVDALFKRMAGEDAPSLVMPPRLAERDTA